MKTTTYAGINYAGHTNANRDANTMIRYGVIPHHAVGSAWYDSSEGHYGKPYCPKCGNEAIEIGSTSEQLPNGQGVAVSTIPDEVRDEYAFERGACGDHACDDCEYRFDGDNAFPDSPLSHYVDDSEISAEQGGDDSDIFISKSKFFTYAQFCSPCAPGACYLLNPLETPSDDNKAYCFGHDWFEDGVAPYPVYSVETGELILPDKR